jgi:hypothetical protein
VTEQLPVGGLELSTAEIDALWSDPWRPEQIAERLAGVSVPWYIAAGWALDLFRGEQTREHEDIEIAVPAAGSHSSGTGSPIWSATPSAPV